MKIVCICLLILTAILIGISIGAGVSWARACRAAGGEWIAQHCIRAEAVIDLNAEAVAREVLP